MKRHLLIATFLLLLTSTASAQVTSRVIGQVEDEARNPLIGATVYLQGTQLGAISNDEGRFVIERVAPGTYNLVVSYIGYTSQTLFNIEVKSVGNPEYSFILVEDVTQLEGVIVAPDKNIVTRPVETPLSTQTLTAVEIATYPGGNNDVVRVAQSLPGISPSPGGFRNDLIIRGGAPNESVYYLDGVEIPNINHFSTQGSSGGPVGLLNVSFIDNVTLSTSAFGAQYDNALSGVLQFDQREGSRSKQSLNFRVSASETALTANGPLFKNGQAESNTSYIVSVRRSYLQFLFELIGLPIRPDYWDYQYKITHRLNALNTLSLVGVGSVDDFAVDATGDIELNELSTLEQAPFIEQQSNTVGLSWRKRFESGQGFVTTTVSNNLLKNDFSRFSDNRAETGRFFYSNATESETKLRSSVSYFWNSWQFVSGVNVQQSTYRNSTEDTNVGFSYATRLSFQKFGLFASASTDLLSNKLKVSLGIRADDDTFLSSNSLLDTVSPRLAASYSLTPEWKLNATAGRYYKLPPYTMLGYRETGMLANKDLNYTRADHYVLGLERILNPSASITLEGFLKSYSDYPVSDRDQVSLANKGADFEVLGNENVTSNGKGRTYGTELLFQQKLSNNFYGIFSYTFFYSEFTGTDRSVYVPSLWDSRHLVSFTGGYQLGKSWEISSRFRYSGTSPLVPTDLDATLNNYPLIVLDYSRIGDERLGAFSQLDVRVDKNWNFNRFSVDLFLEIQNILITDTPQATEFVLTRDEAGQVVNPQSLSPVERRGGSAIPTIGFVVDF
jgi:hypothetical protein